MIVKPQVEVRNRNYAVALRDSKLVGSAHRESPGADWVVTKIHWRGANGAGRVGGSPGGELVIGTVCATGSEVLQRKLVLAMLEQL